MTAEPHSVILEPAAQAFLGSADIGGRLVQPGPAHIQARTVMVDAPAGSIPVRIVEPVSSGGTRPAIVYIGGEVGGLGTHDRMIRTLATGVDAAVVVPELAHGVDVRYPVALEQAYAVAEWICEKGTTEGLDSSRIGIVGDSMGANLAIAVTLLSLQRKDFRPSQLVAFYPVTDAAFDTESYTQFADGYHLRRDDMHALWDRYTTDTAERSLATVSPLRATTEQLRRFPPTLVVTAEADVVRDEGEAFAAKLRQAGVPTTAVRYEGTIHGFVVLDRLAESNAAKSATAQAVSILRSSFASAV